MLTFAQARQCRSQPSFTWWYSLAVYGALVMLANAMMPAAASARPKHILALGHGIVLSLNRFGAIAAVKRKKHTIIEKALISGVAIAPSAGKKKSDNLGYFQAWGDVGGNHAVIRKEKKYGYYVRGLLLPKGQASSHRLDFIVQYQKTIRGKLNVRVHLQYHAAMTWAQAMRYDCDFPVSAFVDGRCIIENADHTVTIARIGVKPMYLLNWGDKAIWLQKHNTCVKITAARGSQLQLLDARGWHEQSLVVRIIEKQPWHTGLQQTSAHAKQVFGAGIDFRATLPAIPTKKSGMIHSHADFRQ